MAFLVGALLSAVSGSSHSPEDIIQSNLNWKRPNFLINEATLGVLIRWQGLSPAKSIGFMPCRLSGDGHCSERDCTRSWCCGLATSHTLIPMVIALQVVVEHACVKSKLHLHLPRSLSFYIKADFSPRSSTTSSSSMATLCRPRTRPSWPTSTTQKSSVLVYLHEHARSPVYLRSVRTRTVTVAAIKAKY